MTGSRPGSTAEMDCLRPWPLVLPLSHARGQGGSCFDDPPVA
jgi:hypothetical protein